VNFVITIGSYILAVSTIPFLINAVWCWSKGKVAGPNPWNSLTLEWTTSSPPPVENFDVDPVLTHGPYDYGYPKEESETVALAS
jgi:cytochrome c oxidase subunit I